MNTKKANGINAINSFIFYIWNCTTVDSGVRTKTKEGDTLSWYVPEVILKAKWNCSTQHMLEKWLGFADDYSTEKAFLRFYAELSSDNRVAMLEWILDNYHGISDIA